MSSFTLYIFQSRKHTAENIKNDIMAASYVNIDMLSNKFFPVLNRQEENHITYENVCMVYVLKYITYEFLFQVPFEDLA